MVTFYISLYMFYIPNTNLCLWGILIYKWKYTQEMWKRNEIKIKYEKKEYFVINDIFFCDSKTSQKHDATGIKKSLKVNDTNSTCLFLVFLFSILIFGSTCQDISNPNCFIISITSENGHNNKYLIIKSDIKRNVLLLWYQSLWLLYFHLIEIFCNYVLYFTLCLLHFYCLRLNSRV